MVATFGCYSLTILRLYPILLCNKAAMFSLKKEIPPGKAAARGDWEGGKEGGNWASKIKGMIIYRPKRKQQHIIKYRKS